MEIGFVIGRIGGIDGVALETEKWLAVLRRMGHRVHVLAGALEGDVDGVTLLPELAFDHPWTVREQAVAFFGEPADEAAFFAELDAQAERIAAGIARWVAAVGIDCLVPENASALPCHLAMGLGIHRYCERSGLPAVTHDHDFAWERGDRYASPFAGVRAIVEGSFPLRLPTVRHAVINSAARATLAERYGIDATVVPNVMDFDAPFATRDDYNATLRADLGLPDDAILLFQITRIVRRKGIDNAIRLVHALDDLGVHLVITGTATDDDDGTLGSLQRLVDELGVGDRVHFAGARFDNQRRSDDRGRKVYSLSDGYAHATACTYFSTYEGFGNAFVECVLARRPIFVNDYEPVYWPDIGSLGFDAVTIRGGRLTDEAIAAIRAVLADPRRQHAIAEHNAALGREHFSYAALERILTPLFPPR